MISSNQIDNNHVNGTGSSGEGVACGMGTGGTQPDPGRHPTTANVKTKWTEELNKIVMKCYLKSDPKKRGFRKRMLTIWNDIGLFEVTEQQLAGQALCIKNRGWLSEVEIEEIERNRKYGRNSTSANRRR